MQTALLISRIKDFLRAALRPLLPLIRFCRTFPARRQAQKQAAALRYQSGLSVCYLTSQFPARPALRTEFANGGAVKLTFLAEHFPHSYPNASLLYTVSSVDNVGAVQIIRQAKQAGLKIVLNQNGVSYPAWNSADWEAPNKKMAEVLALADTIVYQSEFCRLGANKFLGESRAPQQIIYNPVDVTLYQPAQKGKKHGSPVLLLGGNQYERYRFETAVRVLQETLRFLPETKLLITGRLWGENQLISKDQAKQLINKLGVADHVEFIGSYAQSEAPAIFQRADILLHTKYNDPSPNLIAEAMASGLPVVYSASGGVPELVGAGAGIGVKVDTSWEKIQLPDPQLMARAIQQVWDQLPEYSGAARQRAIEQFPLDKFIAAHHELFERLLEG